MNSKIELINEYIQKANEIIEEDNDLAACKLIPEIANVFLNDIKYIWYGVRGDEIKGCERLKTLIAKLRNLKGNLEIEEQKIQKRCYL